MLRVFEHYEAAAVYTKRKNEKKKHGEGLIGSTSDFVHNFSNVIFYSYFYTWFQVFRFSYFISKGDANLLSTLTVNYC